MLNPSEHRQEKGRTLHRSRAAILLLASTTVVYKFFSLMQASVSQGQRSGSVMDLTNSPTAFYSEWRLRVVLFSLSLHVWAFPW